MDDVASDQITALSQFGQHLGLAFQLIDGLLGIWGSPRANGKPADNGLLAGKKPLPVAAALASGSRSGNESAEYCARPERARPDEIRTWRCSSRRRAAGTGHGEPPNANWSPPGNSSQRRVANPTRPGTADVGPSDHPPRPVTEQEEATVDSLVDLLPADGVLVIDSLRVGGGDPVSCPVADRPGVDGRRRARREVGGIGCGAVPSAAVGRTARALRLRPRRRRVVLSGLSDVACAVGAAGFGGRGVSFDRMNLGRLDRNSPTRQGFLW
ncbi:polyprenyl synthetase family protein [Lentzea roselyniae]